MTKLFLNGIDPCRALYCRHHDTYLCTCVNSGYKVHNTTQILRNLKKNYLIGTVKEGFDVEYAQQLKPYIAVVSVGQTSI